LLLTKSVVDAGDASMNLHSLLKWLLGALLVTPSLACATFSIVACDKDGTCGAAVATNNLAVGASVIYAQAHVGALASQFETNLHYGPKGLALLSHGESPEQTIAALLADDGHFDGEGIEARQVGIVDARGRSSTYTGAEAMSSHWAGALRGDGYAVQGNGLASDAVLKAMERAYLSSSGVLAERLMAALEAGQQAGGQTIGRMSAAILIRTSEGDWQDIDLRVDGAPEPIHDLRRLLEQHFALQAIIRAERFAKQERRDDARMAIADALHRSYQWDRIWLRAARLSMQMGDADRTLDCLGVLMTINPVWAQQELQDPLYEPLRTNSLFMSWKAESMQ
jgi:uncharacterized Ntn-hydrolase superfamily protein